MHGDRIGHASEYETSVVLLERVPWEKVPTNGVADLGDGSGDEACFPVAEFVDKPARDEAPSNIATTSR